jgi:hypothetical protein
MKNQMLNTSFLWKLSELVGNKTDCQDFISKIYVELYNHSLKHGYVLCYAKTFIDNPQFLKIVIGEE